jgi:aminoacyl-tRNA hydrolase
MNLSGDSIGPLAKYHQVPSTHVLVIYDELDLPLGTLRLREKGGAGGHNGMRSIINHLGQEFPRMRLGIGRPPGQMSPAAYVLQNGHRDVLERRCRYCYDASQRAGRARDVVLSSGTTLNDTTYDCFRTY